MGIDKLTKNNFTWNIVLVSIGTIFSFILGFTLKLIKGMI